MADTLEDIAEVTKKFMENVVIIVRKEYMLFLQDVRANWDEYFEERAEYVNFTIKDNTKIIWENIKKKFSTDEGSDAVYNKRVQKIMKPITDEIFKMTREKKNGVVVEKVDDDCYIGIKMRGFKDAVGKNFQVFTIV